MSYDRLLICLLLLALACAFLAGMVADSFRHFYSVSFNSLLIPKP